MKYIGKLYGKMGRTYIPLIPTSEDVDKMESDIANYHEALTRIVNENLTHDQVERIAEEALSHTKS